ncbi:MAG: Rap1a/Tai family immunity protein [Luteolibacter sp.]|jgi:hypothetical protein
MTVLKSLISISVCVLVALPLTATNAAQSVRFYSAGQLFQKVSSPRLEEQLAGQHYVMGVLDGLFLAKDPGLCLGSSININDVMVVVREQLVARPDVHRFNAASVIRETLSQRFPCA